MKIPRKKFVAIFLVSGFAFLFIYNMIIRSAVRLIPESGESFLGTESLIGWKSTIATILYPVKIVLVGPVLLLINLPDPPPPFLVIGFAFYWTILALVIYYIIGRIKRPQKTT
jgi:L-asparagine transporter-like permease